MRMPGKQIKQCHSQAVGHEMQHDWWDHCLETNETHSQPVGHGMRHGWWECQANKWSHVTHKLLVMGCNMIDEIAWQTNEAVSLTRWSSCHSEIWLMRMPCKQMKQCHLQAVCHGMRYDWWECQANKWRSDIHFLLVMWWEIIYENTWQTNEAVSLTRCSSWDATWLMRLPGKW